MTLLVARIFHYLELKLIFLGFVSYIYCNFNPNNSKPRKLEAIRELFFVILSSITRSRSSLLQNNEPWHFAPEDYI